MKGKLRVGVLFGGQSAEHEVSLRSAYSIMKNMDRSQYAIFPIGIDKKGSWHFFKVEPFLASLEENRLPSFEKKDPHFPEISQKVSPQDIFFSPCILKQTLDVIFPILHGPFGEDGTVQGLVKLANLPFVGPDVLSSAICMDKGIMKVVLKGAGLPTPAFQVYSLNDSVDEEKVIEQLKLPLFVKPANAGSSVGISKVHRKEELLPAIENAYQYDEKVILEEFIEGRELECSVLGNLDPIVSLPGEILPQHEFYTYEAKYLDENGALFQLPAQLSPQKVKELQQLAVRAFKALQCEGMARIDFFLRKGDAKLFLNELNTIPGFTMISLYPKLWELSGVPYSDLIDRLITLALNRFERKKALKVEYNPSLVQA